ncbi:MAG: hypothetical protein U0840_28890 [Gemmataceae bacterium]
MADTSESRSGTTTQPLPAPELPPADQPRDDIYRPLSLLALGGFSLSVLYAFLVLLGGLAPIAGNYPRLFLLLVVVAPLVGAQVALLGRQRSTGRVLSYAGLGLVILAVVLGLGGLVAYSSTSPWLLLDGVGWLLLLAALGLCWVARSRITTSEGTLAGLKLANWGLALGLFFGLNYGAYLASNSFAITGQARGVAEEFIALIKDTNDPDALLKAFVLTLPPRQRPSSDLRRSIEIEHNVTPDSTGRQQGGFSMFTSSGYFHLLRSGPSQVTFERVESSTFERGGFQVNLIYIIENELGKAELKVGTFGQETAGGPGGRQWQIVPTQTTIVGGNQATEAGIAYQKSLAFTREFVNEWVNKVRVGDIPGSYLDTLTESRRRKLVGGAVYSTPSLPIAMGLQILGAMGLTPEVATEFVDGLNKYRKGDLIKEGPDLFATSEAIRKQSIGEVRGLFQGGGPPVADLSLRENVGAMLGYKPDGNNSEYHFPARVVTRPPGAPGPRYMVDVDIVVLGPLNPEIHSPEGYRIGRVVPIRVQTAPDPQRPPG